MLKSLPLCDGWKFPREDFVFFHIKVFREKSDLFFFPWKKLSPLPFSPRYFVHWTYLQGMIEGCLELRRCQMRQFWERVSLRKLHPTFTLLFIFCLGSSY